MPLNLEHFKMLNAKASSLERGTGGVPQITFQEVADLLARVDYKVSVYGRYVYAKQRDMWGTLVKLVVDEITPEDLEEPTPDYYYQVAELGIRTTDADYVLTNSQKAFAIGVSWWTRKHENLYRKAQSILDEWDYELRLSVKRWNEDHPAWLTDP